MQEEWAVCGIAHLHFDEYMAAFGIAHLHFDEYIMSKINHCAHYFQRAASRFEHWACESEALEEYNQMTLRTFQTGL